MEIMFNGVMDEKRLVIEGTNAWSNNFRSLILRNDTTLYSELFRHFSPSACQIIKNKIQSRIKL